MDDRTGWFLLLALFPFLVGAIAKTDGMLRWIFVAFLVGYLIYVVDVYSKGSELRALEE